MCSAALPVHDDAVPRLELPGAAARGDHERAAAQPRHARLERGQRAQRRIHEQQPEDLARAARAARGALQRAAPARADASTSSREKSARSRKRCIALSPPMSSSAARSSSTCGALEDERRQQPQDVGIGAGAGENAALEQRRMHLLGRPRGAQSEQKPLALMGDHRADQAAAADLRRDVRARARAGAPTRWPRSPPRSRRRPSGRRRRWCPARRAWRRSATRGDISSAAHGKPLPQRLGGGDHVRLHAVELGGEGLADRGPCRIAPHRRSAARRPRRSARAAPRRKGAPRS